MGLQYKSKILYQKQTQNIYRISGHTWDTVGLLSTAALKSLDESSSASSDTSVHKKNSAAVHFTLGNVHATLLNFNESADR